jgi:MIP family channel proteins
VDKSLRSWSAELVGTFVFVTIVSGSVILSPLISTVGVALAHALGLAAMVTCFAAISGGHFNPVVTLSAWVGGKIRTPDALGYVGAQILGALASGLVLRIMYTELQWRSTNLGSPRLSVSDGRGLFVEAVLTFFLVLVIWGTGIDERGSRVGGLPIGFTLGAAILTAGPLTGAGLNPARYLGPAAVAGELGDWWVYFLGPAIGAVAAALVYQGIFGTGFAWGRLTGVRTAPAIPVEPAVVPPPTQPIVRRKPAARKKPAPRRKA